MIVRASFFVLCLALMVCLRKCSAMTLRKGKLCQTDRDCGNVRLCDNGYCRIIRSFADLEKKNPLTCKVFKAPCKSDLDCFCKTMSMICESNECVVRKSINKSDNTNFNL